MEVNEGNVLENSLNIEPSQEQTNAGANQELWQGQHPNDLRTSGQNAAVQPKQDPQRMEYWQSKYDKLETGYKDLSLRAQEMEQYIRQQAEGNQRYQPPVQQPQPGPQRPMAPIKPGSYNEVESYSDPQSASWKYRAEKEVYNDNMVQYYGQQEEARNQILQSEIQRMENAQVQENQMRGLRAELYQKHGYTQNDVDDFVRRYSDPRSLTIDNLVALHKLGRQTGKVNPQTNNKQPLPISLQSGQSEPQLNDEDAFNIGLLSNKRK